MEAAQRKHCRDMPRIVHRQGGSDSPRGIARPGVYASPSFLAPEAREQSVDEAGETMIETWITEPVIERIDEGLRQFHGTPVMAGTASAIKASVVNALNIAAQHGLIHYPAGGFCSLVFVDVDQCQVTVSFDHRILPPPLPMPAPEPTPYNPPPAWNDDAGWNALIAERTKGLHPRAARDETKRLRSWRHSERMEAIQDEAHEARVAALKPGVYAWILSRLDALSKDEFCVDNDRWADKSKSNAVRRYYKHRSTGCCGFHDSEEVCPIDGKTYLLGFNFGH